MYDKLVKALRFCAMTELSEEEYPCDPCKYEPPEKYHIRNELCYLGCFQQMMLHAADAIEELQATLCNWCAVCPYDKRDLSTCEIYESCRAKPPKGEEE